MMNSISTRPSGEDGPDSAEDAARAAVKVLNDVRSRFLSRISHGLRTPLTSILGFSELLVADMNLGHVERDEFCRIIRNETERMLKFIGDIHEYENLRSGKRTVDARKVDLVATLRASVESARPPGEDRRPNVLLTPGLDSIVLHADPSLLASGLAHMFTAALRAVPPGERLLVNVAQRRTTVSVEVREAGEVRVGPRRSVPLRDDPTDDLGLDIAIARKIVELHGGTLALPDVPLVVSISLPSLAA